MSLVVLQIVVGSGRLKMGMALLFYAALRWLIAGRMPPRRPEPPRALIPDMASETMNAASPNQRNAQDACASRQALLRLLAPRMTLFDET